MKKFIILSVFIFILILICMFCSSCNFLYDNDSSDSSNDSDFYGKSMLNQVLDAIENKDKDELINLFSDEVKNKISSYDSIDKLFEFYKGIKQDIDYNYSIETSVFENGEQHKFDECLAYVKTSEAGYWFDFLIYKNNDSKGIISLVVSNEKSREADDFSEYLNNLFNEAEYFNKDYFGVFIFNQEH